MQLITLKWEPIELTLDGVAPENSPLAVASRLSPRFEWRGRRRRDNAEPVAVESAITQRFALVECGWGAGMANGANATEALEEEYGQISGQWVAAFLDYGRLQELLQTIFPHCGGFIGIPDNSFLKQGDSFNYFPFVDHMGETGLCWDCSTLDTGRHIWLVNSR
ncbi:MAG: hypothetical protein NTY81_04040 [Candidatus Staskawiczbacteria bacterium]|nr:hypothetical protein [Candidatus Staskawiczbacteria bacterium]